LAVVDIMLAAFGAACLAHVGAKEANLCFKLQPPIHKSCRRPTHLGAVPVGADAFGHLRNVPFAQTSVGKGQLATAYNSQANSVVVERSRIVFSS
jgi:hypothetical protein